MIINVPQKSTKQPSETQQNLSLDSSNGIEQNVSQNSSQNGTEPNVSTNYSSSPSMEYDDEFELDVGIEFKVPNDSTIVENESTSLNIPRELPNEFYKRLSEGTKTGSTFVPSTSLAMDVMSIQSTSNKAEVHPSELENGISTASLVKELNKRWQTSDPIERLRTLCKEAKDSTFFEPSVTRLGITSLFTAEELKQIKEGIYNEPISSFEPPRFKFKEDQPKNFLPKRNPRTHRIVELNPSLDFHHEQT